MAIEQRQPQGLVDILDKILDKGLVVAGDIKVSLANVELLTIQLRLVICSIDKAEAIGRVEHAVHHDWRRREPVGDSQAGIGGKNCRVHLRTSPGNAQARDVVLVDLIGR